MKGELDVLAAYKIVRVAKKIEDQYSSLTYCTCIISWTYSKIITSENTAHFYEESSVSDQEESLQCSEVQE